MSAAQGGGIERLARAFADTRKRAALMPYVMGGFPTLADSLRIGQACVQAGADVIELGMPYSDPLADGPVIHAAGTRALVFAFALPPDPTFTGPWTVDEYRTTVSAASAEISEAHIRRSHSVSIEKAKRLLGYAPRFSSLEAVHQSVDWLRASGKLASA